MTDKPPPDDPPASTDEPRAIDLITGKARSEDVDPVTLAQLAAWFDGPPAFGDTPPHLIEADAEHDTDDEFEERRARIAALLEGADETFLEHIEQHRADGDELSGSLPEPSTVVDPQLGGFDLSAWKLRLAGEPREIERPLDIEHLLKEVTPQAVLRDLHRPVKLWNPDFERIDLGMDITGEVRRTLISSAMGTSYQVRMREQHSVPQTLAETALELKATLAEPWENAYKVREKNRDPDDDAISNDMLWFGG